MSIINNNNEPKKYHKDSISKRLWGYLIGKSGEEAVSLKIEANKSGMRHYQPLFPRRYNPPPVERENKPRIRSFPDNTKFLSKAELAQEIKNIRKSVRMIKILLLIIIGVLFYPYFASFWTFLQDRTSNLFFSKNLPPPTNIEDQTKNSPSLKVSAGTLFVNKTNEGVNYEALVVDISNLNLFLSDDEGRPLGDFQNLKNWLSKNKQKLVFATNAGIYGRDIQPLGLHVENGKLIRKLNLSNEEKISDDKTASGNFFMFPNGVFLIKNGEASIVESNLLKDVVDWKDVKLAAQSGPLLLLNNEIHPKFNPASPNRKIRNGVGIINKNKVVFIITKDLVTFYDFAMIFKNKFNCKDALYLDGVISKMYIPEIDGDNAENDLFAGMFAVFVPSERNN